MNRRTFLKTTGGAALLGASLPLLPSTLRGASTPPSKRLTVGFVGTGNIAQGHLFSLLGRDDTRVLGVCDVDTQRREAAKRKVDEHYGDSSCLCFNDFHELVTRPDLDVIYVCTPDHWHALPALEALRQGKDVYVEKPLTLTIPEGRALARAASLHQRVLQTGTQQRSSLRFRAVAEFIRGGGLGPLREIEVLIPPNNKYCGATWKEAAVPEGLDWDRWLGPAQARPYPDLGCHYIFRFIQDYALGQVTNWGVHYIDIAQWALGRDDTGPVLYKGQGEFPSSGLFTAATYVDFSATYADGVTLHCRTRNDGKAGSLRFIGDKDWLEVTRESADSSSRTLLREAYASAGKGPVRLTVSNNHHSNFLNCVRDRSQTISHVEAGHRSTSICVLGNLAMRLRRPLHWDPLAEKVLDDGVANRLLHGSLRSPWSLA